jgi:hypothetical protein
MLEAAAGAEKRPLLLARVANGQEHAFHAAVGTAGDAPQSVEVGKRMATRQMNPVKRVGATAILVLSSLVTAAFATTWRVHEALKGANMLFTATLANGDAFGHLNSRARMRL